MNNELKARFDKLALEVAEMAFHKGVEAGIDTVLLLLKERGVQDSVLAQFRSITMQANAEHTKEVQDELRATFNHVPDIS